MRKLYGEKENHKKLNLLGVKLGLLTVIKYLGTQPDKTGKRRSRWLCQCDCGKTIEVIGPTFKYESPRNCGCLNPKEAVDRILSRYFKDEKTGCWNYTGGKNSKSGHCRLSFHNKKEYVHRVSYWHHKKSKMLSWEEFQEKTEEVCHHCDNPCCINPDHLFEGTQSDNMKDAAKKGRINRGAKNHNCKLTEKQVKEIYKANGTQKEIAVLYKTSQSNVFNIKNNNSWKWLNKE